MVNAFLCSRRYKEKEKEKLILTTMAHNTGHNHPTFRAPPLDGSLTFASLFEYNAHHSPHHTWIRYAEEDAPHHCHDIAWSQGIKAIRAAAHRVTQALGRPTAPGVVAILAATGEE